MLYPKALAERLHKLQLSPAEEAKAALDHRTLYMLTLWQWQTLLDYLSAETRAEILKQMQQPQAGTISLVCSMLLPGSRCIAVSGVRPAVQSGMPLAVF